MNCVAFLTYNTVGEGLSNGWHEGPNGRRALVLQNTTGEQWAVRRDTPDAQCESNRRSQIDILWSMLQEALENLDHVVVYVGVRGSERAIELAGKLPASKVTFVACDCSLSKKEMMIQAAGLYDAGRILCECGGHRKMRRLFDNFMHSGELLPQPAMTA